MAHELAAAVDLDGLHRRGEGLDDGVEEAPRASARSVLKAVAARCKQHVGEDARDHEPADGADGADSKSPPEPP